MRLAALSFTERAAVMAVMEEFQQPIAIEVAVVALVDILATEGMVEMQEMQELRV